MTQNVNKGIAPSSRMVEQHFSDIKADKREDCDGSGPKQTWAASKKWMQRFLSRWSLRWDGLSCRDKNPVYIMRQKVFNEQRIGHPWALKI
jgi:hypothetical protein